jgi:hypothetical protein
MIKLKSILLEQADPKLLGFAKSIVGTIMTVIPTTGFDIPAMLGGPEKIFQAIRKIKTQEQYEAVLDLCKTSTVLKQKFSPTLFYPVPGFPFNTVMELVQKGFHSHTGGGSDPDILNSIVSILQKFNPEEKIIRK